MGILNKQNKEAIKREEIDRLFSYRHKHYDVRERGS